VRSRVDNYYSIWFQIEKKGKRVGQVQLEFLFFKGGEYSSQYRDHALPADSLYLFDNRSHGNYIRILEHEFLGETEEEREQVAKALLQTVMEFGNLNHVDGRVCMSVGGGEEVILYRQGVRCEREDLNSCIAKWSDDNDLKDHGGFTMFVTRECAEKFNKLITEHPIYQAHSG
jgi:hypothetical protein